MMRPGRILQSLFAILLILFLSYLILNYLGKPKTEDYTPTIAADLLDGSPVSLERYRGKPLLVYFWSTWCPTCKYQSPAVEALAGEYQVLTVCVYSGNDTQVREFMKKNGFTFPVINDYNNEVRRAFRVKALPTTFVLNAEGKIVFSEVGMMTGFGQRARLKLAE